MHLSGDAQSSTPARPRATPPGSRHVATDLPVVLVVEDDVEVSAQLCDILRYRGLDPRPAYQGPEAVQLFTQYKPQAIVLDLMLPYMNGVQVLERVRRLQGGDRVPVLVISAIYRDSQVFERDCRRLGVREFLAKPFSLFTLADRVESAIGRGVKESPAVPASPADDSLSEPSTPTAPPSWPPRNAPLVVGNAPDVPALPSIDGNIDRPMERLELMRFVGALCCSGRSGTLVVEQGRDCRIEVALVGGRASRVAGDSLPETWERLRVLGAAEREAAADRIVARVLDNNNNRVQFTPGTVPRTAADLKEVDLLRALFEASTRTFEFNGIADDLSRRVGRLPAARPGFDMVFGRLGLKPPIDALPALMKRRMTVEQLYNRISGDSTTLVRVLWWLEQLRLLEYVRP